MKNFIFLVLSTILMVPFTSQASESTIVCSSMDGKYIAYLSVGSAKLYHNRIKQNPGLKRVNPTSSDDASTYTYIQNVANGYTITYNNNAENFASLKQGGVAGYPEIARLFCYN